MVTLEGGIGVAAAEGCKYYACNKRSSSLNPHSPRLRLRLHKGATEEWAVHQICEDLETVGLKNDRIVLKSDQEASIIDMSKDGVSTSPIKNLHGGGDFNEVVFDDYLDRKSTRLNSSH